MTSTDRARLASFWWRGISAGAMAIAAALAMPASTRAAQPDYTNAIWRSAYAGHWYTTGNARAFVVEHDMEGYYLATISYFQQSGTQASIHYCVNGQSNGTDTHGHTENNPGDSPAGEITQMVEEQNWAWHVLCWNRYMLGTEHEGFVNDPAWYTDEMYQASGRLTRYLCDKWNIPKDRNHVIGHNEWQNAGWRVWMTNNWPQIDPTCNNHTDPGVFWDWNKFMAIVSGAPGISVQPWSRLAEPGSNVLFSVAATGSAPLRYQWRKNGAAISGATTSTYGITNVQPINAAGYSVTVSNTSGILTSRVATLTVSPAWVTVFTDNFETNSSANWNLFWGAGNGVADFTTNWVFNYGATTYVANGVTNVIPAAPNSGGTTHGLKLTVNKNDATAATAGVSLYPRNLVFSNDYALRFDMWLNYNGGPGGGTGSTEYGTFGLNHTGTEVNWTTTATASDGLWFAVDGEGGSGGSDYRAYSGNGAAAPTQLAFANGGLAASGAASDNAGDAFFHGLFPGPTYETAGAPGKHWVQGEVSQINNVITWQLNGVVIAQRTNTSGYTSGEVMIGYMDPYTSIANPGADNYVLFDNVRVLRPAAAALVNNLVVAARPSSALITWMSQVPTRAQIEYGVAPSYGQFSTQETASGTNHAILLVGLLPNSSYVFRIHSLIGPSETISTQYGFSTDVSLIVDNPEATYSGNWTLSSSAPDEYGGAFQYATTTIDPTPSAQATYVPTIVTPGKYNVFIWYPQSSSHSANAQVSIFHNAGLQLQGVDQTAGGGGWRLLGSALDFIAGRNGSAAVGNNTGEADRLVAADAFKWVYDAGQDIPADGTVPGWWSAYYFGTNVNAALDPDGDGYSTYMEYVMGTSPTDNASHFSAGVTRVGNGIQLTFAPWQGGRIYQLQWTDDLGGAWQTLPDVPSVINYQGIFSIANNGAPGPRFYRVAVRLSP